MNDTPSLRRSSGQRLAVYRQSSTVRRSTPMSSANICNDSVMVNRSSVPFGIDPPTALIGSISSHVTQGTLRAGDLRDQFLGLGDELFVTLPGDVPDPVDHVGHDDHRPRPGPAQPPRRDQSRGRRPR
ncbi:hypothetical protein [Streptomyces dangxiongensis]|uniref:hypothetical protein n=1 Tax=Streptomyces dangxiongensis TaxID=1442032 RepID=UPI00196A10E7|nr:hypothetical protein [Streptomyces dangxiongensis]